MLMFDSSTLREAYGDSLDSMASFLSPNISLNASVLRSGFENTEKLDQTNNNGLLSQSSKTVKGLQREFSLPKEYEKKIEYSARAFLPYVEMLRAVNILLKHENISKVEKLRVNFEAHEDSAILEDGVLNIRIQMPEQITTIEMLKIFIDGLGWNFEKAIKEVALEYPFLLASSDQFDAINIIIHERLAGLGDLVFICNSGQIFSRMLPHKTIRLIFHSDDDFKLVCKTKLLKGLDPDNAYQMTGGMEIINAHKLGADIPKESKNNFGLENENWHRAQKDIVGQNDISLVYALGGTPKEIMNQGYRLRMFAGDVKVKLFVYELGFSSLMRDPLSSGEIHLGFGKDDIGMPPVSPVSEIIYAKKYPRIDKKIQAERKRIIKKFSGWEGLNSVSNQKDLEKTIASEWGFLYAHMQQSVKNYFETFQSARRSNKDFNQETTFFVMCSRGDAGVISEVKKLAAEHDYNLLIYAQEGGKLEIENRSKSNNVTLIMDYSVPRKLFNELFLYSDDLPTLVSGQDNLANIIYLNLLTTGRPFFWEVLVFQATALYDMLGYLKTEVGESDADKFKQLISNSSNNIDAQGMFLAPREYRNFYKKIAQALDKHNSFIAQMYYLLLKFGKDFNFSASKKAQSMNDKLETERLNAQLIGFDVPSDNSISNVNSVNLVQSAI